MPSLASSASPPVPNIDSLPAAWRRTHLSLPNHRELAVEAVSWILKCMALCLRTRVGAGMVTHPGTAKLLSGAKPGGQWLYEQPELQPLIKACA